MQNHTHDNIEAELPVRHPQEAIAALNAKLAGKKGKFYWKSFEELAETEEFQKFVDDEFPNRASLMQVDRRKFLTLGGAAFALAGLSGCRFLPQMKAVPYVRAPEEMVVGVPMQFTSTLIRGGYGLGVVVESQNGRPTKIEGNPNHPASLGSTDIWAQAEILGLYDPDRSQAVMTNGEVVSWDQFHAVSRKAFEAELAGGGAGIAILSETNTSPTLAAQKKQLLAKFPQAKWYEYEPATRDNIYQGTKLVFSQPVSPIYKLRGAKVIVSLDSDFLLTDGNNANVRYAREFADGRRVMMPEEGGAPPTMNRLYAFDTGYTITGASADHRFAVKPSQLEGIARALYSGVNGGAASSAPGIESAAIAALVKDLTSNKGAAIVIPGDEQPPAVHALAHAINASLGATGSTVVYMAPLESDPGNQVAGLKTLTDAINAGSVKILLLAGGNPVYNAPADLKFSEALLSKRGGVDCVPLRIRLGRYNDETSATCHWHLPESHPLEAWSDARGFDGTASITQPLIAPLYDSRSIHEVLSEIVGEPQDGYDIVHGYWSTASAGSGSAQWWETALVNGVIANSASEAITVTAVTGLDTSLPAAPGVPTLGKGQAEVAIRMDPTLYDGRYANNSWLQEVPKPVTTITWDNAALMSPKTAQNLGVVADQADKNMTHVGDVNGKQLVTIDVNGAKVTLPVWILAGLPEDTITVHLGFGRTAAGNVGDDQGSDTYVLRTMANLGVAVGTVTEARGEYQISATQAYHSLMGINEDRNRNLILASTLEEFIAKSGKIAEPEEVEYHVPEIRAFPVETADTNVTNPDGSLGQDANMDGSKQAAADTIVADAYRKEWKYTNIAQSNQLGNPTVYPEFSNAGFNAWGMGIDLTTCIGCNACSVACQAENNIPTVGKEQVGKGRHMHWLRIDHYYAGPDIDNVESYFQPLACVQCEKAPCEPVCPVAATVHSHEGINQMVYNRCIGTRYCSNNCPYKVRRFNFLKWTAGIGGPTTVNYDLPVLKMLANPEVTVRGRGVMEKCNYCIQRISAARIAAKKDEREIRDGEVVTACQQACPTKAIVFGDINDPNSVVSKWRKQPHDYTLLADLNTRPRTTYLGRIRNPNPEVAGASSKATSENAG